MGNRAPGNAPDHRPAGGVRVHVDRLTGDRGDLLHNENSYQTHWPQKRRPRHRRRVARTGLLRTIHQAEARRPHARRWTQGPTMTMIMAASSQSRAVRSVSVSATTGQRPFLVTHIDERVFSADGSPR